MKKNLFITVLAFFITYLMFAFVNVTFDFRLWDSEVRTCYILLSLIFTIGYLTYPK
jgi:hypothetical protein